MYKFYPQNMAGVLTHRLCRKILLIMKLTTLVLITLIMHVSASSLAQKVTLVEKDAPLEDVFDEISNQTGYDFLFTGSNLKFAKPVTINVTHEELNDVLKKIFAGQPLDFLIQNKSVVIKDRITPVLEDKTRPAFATVAIIGKVTDEHGNPLPGVTIKQKNTSLAFSTNAKGEFTALVATQSAILQFSFIGYITQEIPVTQLKSPAVIVLKEDISKLDEVQIIAYGTTTKRANTGDVTTVDSNTIQKYPTNNVLDVLQGTVPGMAVYKNTGNVTSTYKVQIRGMNGLPGDGGSPLYVVDGVPFIGGSVESLNNTSGAKSANGVGNQAYDALSLINPDDIESISVLKDADATAIYGSRGADGVILITTKKGKVGTATIDASVYTGVTHVAKEVPLLNLQQYLQMRKEAHANDNTPINSITDVDINGVWDTTRSTDWQKQLIGGYGHNTKAQVGISGGTDLVQYRVSGSYNYVTSLEAITGNDQTANFNISLTSTTSNHKFTASFTGGYFYDLNTMSQTDYTYTARTLPPDAPALYTSTGALNFQNNTFANPLLAQNYINSSPRTNLTSNLVLSYRPISDLEIKLSAGYNKQNLNEFLGSPSTITPPYSLSAPISTFTYDNSYAWSIEPQIDYNKQIGKGKLLVTVGASLQDETSSSEALSASGYSTDLLLSSITAGTAINMVFPYTVSPNKFAATFGRINYNWANKYYIDLTGRDDGSSNFGQNRQYHLFAAAGAGWIFSEEDLIKNNLSFLSFGKLRGSYGTTGRDDIAPYSYLSTYNTVSSQVGSVPYGGVSGLVPSRLPNPDLSWETTTKAELGLELQFLKGRIAFETNFYCNRTTGLLTGATLPVITGFNSINENLPATIQNEGFDATLTTANIRNKDFSWSTTIIFTHDQNKLLKFPGLATSPYANTYVIGQPINIVKAYKFDGVNPQTGNYQVIAANGSVTSLPNSITDKTQLVNTNPVFYGSVQNNITYKQFSLSFLFRYVKQTGLNEYGNLVTPSGYSATNTLPIVLNRWQKPGDVTNIERYGTNFFLILYQADLTQSNFAYSNASYIRLQNLSLSYALPTLVSQKFGMHNLQVFIQGDNLLTITGYKGLDPETQSIFSLPPLRIITAGLRLTI